MEVRIQITRRTELARTVEMSEEQYESLKEKLRSPSRKSVREAEKYLNSIVDGDDWQDDEFHSLDEFEQVLNPSSPIRAGRDGRAERNDGKI